MINAEPAIIDRKAPSDAFVKVYREILDSSIAENYELRHFFEDMLKLADWKTGIVDMTPGAIGRRINLPLDKVERFLAELEKPDKESKTPAEDGRRIIRLSDTRTWGWQITNYELYRLTRSADERREYNRVKKQESRERLAAKVKKPRARAKAVVSAQHAAGEKAYTIAMTNGATEEEAREIAARKEAEFRQ